MSTIIASSSYHINPYGGAVVSGGYISPWKNRIFGYCYIDTVPVSAQVLVFNNAISELLGSTVSAADGSFEITTIPQRYSESPLTVIMRPFSTSDTPLIKSGIYPAT